MQIRITNKGFIIKESKVTKTTFWQEMEREWICGGEELILVKG
jgi:hypothetical protein